MPMVGYHWQLDHGTDLAVTAAAKDLTGLLHLLRYSLTWQLLGGRESCLIYDLGCGSGFGAAQLSVLSGSAKHRQVIGVDIDRRAINASLGSYGSNPSLSFRAHDLNQGVFASAEGGVFAELAKPPAPPVFVCIETLEMIKHRDVFLSSVATEVARHPGSLFVVSAPVPRRTRPDFSPRNSFIAYDTQLLMQVLKSNFKQVSCVRTVPEIDDTCRDVVTAFQQVIPELSDSMVGHDIFLCRQ